MASLVLCMQLRSLFHEFKQRLAKHRKIIRVKKVVNSRFADASSEDLSQSPDKCAICWEAMEKAKKLKCGHLFHSECLCSWLVHDSSCPTCRNSLEEEMKSPSEQGERQPRRTLFRNHFFHFDGRQIASWFPSFSVEVLHTSLGGDQPQMPESRIDAMAHEVQTIFPNIPINVIRADLSRTHSVDITSDNILEGTIHVPPSWEESTTSSIEQPPSSPPSLPPPPEQQPAREPEVSTSDYHENEQKLEQAPERPGNEAAEEKPRAGPSGESAHGIFGAEFSDHTNERQTSLSERKQTMLQKARKRYLEKKS